MSRTPFASGVIGKSLAAVATLGPLGTRMPAPGTWGSGAGLLLYTLVFHRYNNATYWTAFLAVSLALILVAIAVCAVAEKHLGKKDPGEVILDEFIAMPLVYIGAEPFIKTAPQPWLWFLVGFALFRFFDVTKPLGIKKLQSWPGGIGIVADDLAAALAACGSLHALNFLIGFLR